ncbi:hypothetical protein SAMN05421868_13428 [Paenibacillus naphthalenovorans]|nr:hypothetical protein SAMN05421868_13428 [Paenibacillus naphthalenovorans]
MTTTLIIFLCMLVSVILFSAAFYMAHYVVQKTHRIAVLEDSYKEATEHIAEQDRTILQLQQELDFVRRDEEMRATQNVRQRTWNPGDPLNSGNRHSV